MSERLAKAETLFHEALEMPSEQREAFLRNACGEDAGLLREVTALLRAAGISDQWLKDSDCAAPSPAFEPPRLDSLNEGPGSLVGRYKLLEKIGEGGFGAVYMAEQQEPVRRRVALKIIKLGMDTRSVIARFEAERQALALMDHPNIAKVLDAGATETGRPYFVMELVRGVPITRFCEENQLGVVERLELFIQVCGAIQHAHQKGIIHRDIKPTNVLVTLNDSVPHPMVIDFGVAKAINQRLTEKTLFTNFAQMIGTPAYMSPEQAEMSKLDVDTRSDVYSLGVLLYELLTGTTPFPEERLRSAGYVEMQRIICEEKPPLPSTRITRSSGLHSKPSRASHLSPLATDLDWIVMKCLEKDRIRRYETANGLATDLQRHLDNQPVLARPPSRLYEFQKSVRRHKVGFAATAAVITALLLGILAAGWEASRARQTEHEARANAYAADMHLAQQALAVDNAREAQALLDRYRPRGGEPDLRGWEWRYLWQQLRSDALSTLDQRPNPVHSLTVSYDGKWLAVGEQHHGGLSVWNLTTRKETPQFRDVAGEVVAAFSPNGKLLAFSVVTNDPSGDQKYSVWVWDRVAQRIVIRLPLEAACRGLGFSPDGERLVTSTPALEGNVVVWKVPEGTKLQSFSAPQSGQDAGTPFAVAPDFSVAAQRARDSGLRVVDLATGSERWKTNGNIFSLAFSPDGEWLAAADGLSQPSIRLFNVANGEELTRLTGHREWVSALVFWPDKKRLASASADQTIRIWSLRDLASPRLVETLRGHKHEVWALALLPDEQTLVSGCKDGSIFLWDSAAAPHRGAAPITLSGKFQAWRFTPDSRAIITCDRQGHVEAWAGPGFRQGTHLFDIAENNTNVWFSEDARWVATGATNGTVRIWDVQRAALQRELPCSGDSPFTWAFLDHGRRVVIYDRDQSMAFEWDVNTATQLRSWRCPPDVSAWAFSPDEQWCLMLGYGGSNVLCRLASSSVFIPEQPIKYAQNAAFSPDGRLIAAVSDWGVACLWDRANLRETGTFTGFALGAHSVAFSPDGTRLATGCAGSVAIRLWGLQSNRELLALDGSGELSRSTAFSPNGDMLGSLSSSGLLQLWCAPSWEETAARGRPK